jgi:hypothetical protein
LYKIKKIKNKKKHTSADEVCLQSVSGTDLKCMYAYIMHISKMYLRILQKKALFPQEVASAYLRL